MVETFLIYRLALVLCALFLGVASINVISGVASFVRSHSKTRSASHLLAPAHSK